MEMFVDFCRQIQIIYKTKFALLRWTMSRNTKQIAMKS